MELANGADHWVCQLELVCPVLVLIAELFVFQLYLVKLLEDIVEVKLVLVLSPTMWACELDVILVHVRLVESDQQLEAVELRALVDVK